MMVALALLVMFCFVGLAFLRLCDGETKFEQLPMALPLGMSVCVLVILVLWMGGVPIAHATPLITLGSVSAFAFVFGQRRFLFSGRSVVRRGAFVFRTLFFRQSWWGETALWFVVLFSLAVVSVWQLCVHPVIWDALVLYDFRALRMAEGWVPTTFMQLFSGAREYAMYDFLHPFFSSTLGALVYSLRGEHVAIFSLALQLTVLWRARQVFTTNVGMLVFSVLFLASPLFITAAVEGYAVWYATLFWLHLILFLWPKRYLMKRDWLVVGLFTSAAMQSRMSEPYWVLFLLWLLWKYRPALTHFLLSGLTVFFPFVQFYALVHIAAGLAPNGGSLSSYQLEQYRLVSFPGISEVIVPVVVSFFTHTPVMVFLAYMLVLLYIQRRANVWRAFRSWLVLVFAWTALLFVGMVVLRVVHGGSWSESVLSLGRASLPLLALIAVVCAGVADYVHRQQEGEFVLRLQP